MANLMESIEKKGLGACFCMIQDAELIKSTVNSKKRLKLNLYVSNFNTPNEEITVTVFSQNNNLSYENFVDFMRCSTTEELRNIEFYANISVNKSGFYELRSLIYKVEGKNPFYDPTCPENYELELTNIDFEDLI